MEIYRVHVSLREIEPAIWRRIELSSQTTLKQLHRILFSSADRGLPDTAADKKLLQAKLHQFYLQNRCGLHSAHAKSWLVRDLSIYREPNAVELFAGDATVGGVVAGWVDGCGSRHVRGL